jgi:hypothetical protein
MGQHLLLAKNPALLEDALGRCEQSAALREDLAQCAFEMIKQARYSEALRIFDAIIEFGDLTLPHYCNALWVAQRDNTRLSVDAARSRRYLDACLLHAEANPAIHLNAACVFTELDEPDSAITQLLLAVQAQLDISAFLNEPLLATLKSHPRWALVESAAKSKSPTPSETPSVGESAKRPLRAWASDFSAEDYTYFRGLIVNHLCEANVPFRDQSIDHGFVDVPLGRNTVQRCELEFLARRCLSADRSFWKSYVGEYLRFAVRAPKANSSKRKQR